MTNCGLQHWSLLLIVGLLELALWLRQDEAAHVELHVEELLRTLKTAPKPEDAATFPVVRDPRWTSARKGCAIANFGANISEERFPKVERAFKESANMWEAKTEAEQYLLIIDASRVKMSDVSMSYLSPCKKVYKDIYASLVQNVHTTIVIVPNKTFKIFMNTIIASQGEKATFVEFVSTRQEAAEAMHAFMTPEH